MHHTLVLSFPHRLRLSTPLLFAMATATLTSLFTAQRATTVHSQRQPRRGLPVVRASGHGEKKVGAATACPRLLYKGVRGSLVTICPTLRVAPHNTLRRRLNGILARFMVHVGRALWRAGSVVWWAPPLMQCHATTSSRPHSLPALPALLLPDTAGRTRSHTQLHVPCQGDGLQRPGEFRIFLLPPQRRTRCDEMHRCLPRINS